jgi:hypothetical protein
MYRLSGKEGGEGVLFHCANAAKSGTGWPSPIAGWVSGQHVYCTYAASPCNPIATSLQAANGLPSKDVVCCKLSASLE